MPHKLILLVEDDPAIAEPLRYALQREGWQVDWQMTAQDALRVLKEHTQRQQPFDCLILDVGLPDLDGFDLCRQIRQHWQTPLLFLTARNDEIDRIVGLEIGADDYCGKPFSPREIISRIKAIWRRMQSMTSPTPVYRPPTTASSTMTEHQPIIAWGAWHYEPNACRVLYHGQLLSLTRYELGVLDVFLRHPEQVFSREQLMQQVWQHPEHSLDRTVDSHIKTLRQKLRAIDPTDPITTHRGLGYSLLRY
ncbi:MAG: two-component system response regulator CreB [Pseudomonadota bacterium]|nr:two-component system response regulator CreB [Pseudomonadota bacterium]